MSHPTLYFVGTDAEIAHHASPLMEPLADFAPQVVTADEVIAAARPGGIAVFYSEHFERFRCAIDRLKNNSVATLYMIDGVLEWRNAWENQPNEVACPHTMRPVLCHKVACIGENQARILSSWGNQAKIEVVGVPRFDRYLKHNPRLPNHWKIHTPPAQPNLNVLVITAKTPAFTNNQLQTVKRSLTDLKRFAANPANKVNLQWRLTAGLDKYLKVQNAVLDLTGDELSQQLQTVDAVIATPSTSVVEAMLADRPTAVLNYHVCPTYLSPAWQIGGPEQIAPVIKDLWHPPQAKMMFQRHTLNQTLALDSNATERMVMLIRSMTRLARDQIDRGQPLCFTQPLLERPREIHPPFDHRQLYPDDDAFHRADVIELQALLSNARRHIDHQCDRIADLESELAEAHDIFDQINTHPLAGPVIRLRKRILKLLSTDSPNKVQIENTDPPPPYDSEAPLA